MSPSLVAAVVIAWGASVGVSGWWFYGAGQDAEIADQAKIAKVRQETRDDAQQGAALAISQQESRNETIIQPIRTEIRTNTVYRDCHHSPDQLRRLNDLIRGGEAGTSGGGVVPGASAPE